MSIPTNEQYRQSSARWRREHRGVSYELNHHGISDYSPQGTWCYYLFLRPDMFQSAEHFELFDKPAEVKPMLGSGTFYENFNYYDIPDLNFHGGVTWYSKEPYLDRVTGDYRHALKIGCDYNHSWDRDDGYWHGLEDVDRDAKRSIDILVDQYPQNERCGYSGIMAHPSEFYTAVNGRRIHTSQADKFDDGWKAWRPAQMSEPSNA